ncbi:MAG: hypothetical protein AVDCRST_MAG93-3466, partial [uncultured Chloroflexia bacterium]
LAHAQGLGYLVLVSALLFEHPGPKMPFFFENWLTINPFYWSV